LQSAPKSGLGTFAVIDAVAGRLDESPPLLRRRWSAEAKARILEEALAPGANVSAVARVHGLSPQQLFAWRRKAIRSGAITLLAAGGAAPAQSFAAVQVAREDDADADGLEIVIGDATIRVERDVAPALLVAAIRAVRAA
jgi:transposase